MSKRWLSLNLLLAAISMACLVYTGRTAVLAPIAPASGAPPPATPAPPPPSATASPEPSSPSHTVIAARNLFSPTRTEAATAPPTVGAPTLQKPSLYGVVLRDGAPIAYLEDPVTRRVAGYRSGDSVAGGTVQRITADRVVIRRPEGKIDVLLHDPTRPRAAPEPPRAPTLPAPRVEAPAGQALPPTAPPQPPAARNIIRRPPPTWPDAPPR